MMTDHPSFLLGGNNFLTTKTFAITKGKMSLYKINDCVVKCSRVENSDFIQNILRLNPGLIIFPH